MSGRRLRLTSDVALWLVGGRRAAVLLAAAWERQTPQRPRLAHEMLPGKRHGPGRLPRHQACCTLVANRSPALARSIPLLRRPVAATIQVLQRRRSLAGPGRIAVGLQHYSHPCRKSLATPQSNAAPSCPPRPDPPQLSSSLFKSYICYRFWCPCAAEKSSRTPR